MRRKGKVRSKPIKEMLRSAGVTYREVAEAAGVTVRMVQFVVDGERVSAPVMRAVGSLTAQRRAAK